MNLLKVIPILLMLLLICCTKNDDNPSQTNLPFSFEDGFETESVDIDDSSDGTATIIASSGVAPYNYQVVNWTTGIFYNNTTGVFTGLTAGNYTIWVTDANGCTPSCTGQAFTVTGNVMPLMVTATAQNVDCPSNSINRTNVIKKNESGFKKLFNIFLSKIYLNFDR